MSDDLLIDKPAPRRSWFSRLFRRNRPDPMLGEGPVSGGGGRLRSTIKWTAIVVVLVIVLYYPVGMVLTHKINDDPNFSAPPVEQGASQAVATAAALLDREVNHTAWPANDPFFFPGWALDNMPNFQKGMIGALKRFSIELQDQIGRNRSTSSADPDLQTAASALNYAPDVWVWNPTVSIWPTATSEDQYRQGRRALLAYNARLAKNNAAFERRADNLIDTLNRIGNDLGAASEKTNRQIDQYSGNWVDFHADDVFYQNKGLLYANALLLRDLGKDFSGILAEKGAKTVWDRMVESMLEGAELRPWIVINGRPDALLQPNHLAAQGFYLIRARAQLEELNDILIK
jgi:hypothetical protein